MASIRETIERLSDVQTGGRTNVEQLASKVNGNARLVEDIIQLVTKEAESELAFIVYEWLYNCYKLRHDDISLFVLQCTSPIIYNYLSAISSMNAQLQSHTEPCLLEIYNQVAVEGDAVRGKQAFSIPSVAKSSIYHHRKTLQGKPSSTPLLTESALNKHDLKSQKVASLSLSRISRVIACNRMSVVAVVLCRIQAVMLDMSLTARISFCHMCVRLVASGFPQWTAALSIDSLRFSHLQSSSSLSHSEIMELAVKQRLHLTSTVLHEMISSVYVCLYHDEYLAARQAVEAIRLRAQFDGVAHVLLAANAMLNGLKSIDGDPMAGPLGFSFASSQVMSRKTSTVKYQLDVIDHTDGNEAFSVEEIDNEEKTDDSVLPEIQVLDDNEETITRNERVEAQDVDINETVAQTSGNVKEPVGSVELLVARGSHDVETLSPGDVEVEMTDKEVQSIENDTKLGKPLWTGLEYETVV